jgi:hypothetical protein
LIGIFISLILLALVILVYRKDLKNRNYGWLFIFRLLVIIFLGLMVIGNIIAFTFYQSPKIPLLVLTDVSPSMKDKINQTQTFLTQFKSINKYKTQYFTFADSLFGSQKTDSLSIQGNRTDIAKALIMAKRKGPGAILLLSDGQQNALFDPIAVASELSFPVYTIGLGRTSEKDVSIRTLSAPKQIYLGETANVIVRIMSQGLGSKKAKVSILQGTKELQQQTITLSDAASEQELNFRIIPTEVGKNIYKVIVSSFEEEVNLLNNEKDFGITVLKSKLKVMILSNSPDFNLRFLIGALKSELIEVVPVFAFQGNRFQTTTERGIIDFAFQLNCDVLIMDNFDASQVSADISNQIQKFVEDGGGLLVLWGEIARFNQTLSSILPFVHNQRIIHKEVFIKLTDQGVTVPIFFDGGENLLDNTPPLLGIGEVKEPQKETQVWATADPLGTPLIGYRKSGQGKVIEITGFPIWRWGFYGQDLENEQKKFQKFLIQTVRFLALKDFERFELETDQPVYSAGEKVTFTFQAYQEDGRPWQGLDVSLIIGQEEIPMVEITSGIYEKTVEALLPKDYTVKAVAKLDTLQVGQTRADFRVSETNIEMVETGLNSDLLKRIAQASGGEYYDAASFPVNNFEITLAKYHNTFRFDPRRSVFLYVLFAVLFLTELYFRKRRGLM